MIYRCERPKCRKAIEYLLKEYDCDLEGLLHHPTVFLSPGLKKQCRKMLQEESLRFD